MRRGRDIVLLCGDDNKLVFAAAFSMLYMVLGSPF